MNALSIKPLALLADDKKQTIELPLMQLVRVIQLVGERNNQSICQGIYWFKKDAYGRVLLSLGLRVIELTLNCTICLADFKHDFTTEVTLEVLANTEDCSSVDSLYEPVVMHEGKLNLLEVISDELLLSLPQRHLAGCEVDLIGRYVDDRDNDIDKINPFGVLADN